MDEQQQWYVTIAGNAVGPVSTDLVLRGIKHKKIATEAYVCVVGASEWLALTDVPEFHGALKENGLLPATAGDAPAISGTEPEPANNNRSSEALSSVEEDDESETTAQFSSRRLMDLGYSQQAPVPAEPVAPTVGDATQVALLASKPESAMHDASGHTGADAMGSDTTEPAVVTREAAREQLEAAIEPELALPSEPRNGKHAAALEAQGPAFEVDIDVHVTVDEPDVPAIDWNRGFADYFLVDAEVTLPEEQLLLRSLATTPHDMFLHDEPMWNLALCLAFGTNAVASLAADVFFDVVAAHAQHERIEWMARTLLSRGFMPSGIPHAAGNQGIGRLRQACPDEFLVQLESHLGI